MDNIFQTILILQRKLKNSEVNIIEINKDAETMNKQIASELKACYGTIADLKAKNRELTEKLISTSEPSSIKEETTCVCVLCFENQRNVLFRPCNHLLICDTCSGKTSFYECIACKKDIESYEYAYL